MTITLDIPADSLDQLAFVAQRSFNTTNLAYAIAKLTDDHISRRGAVVKEDYEGCFDKEIFLPPPAPATPRPQVSPARPATSPGTSAWEEFAESIEEMLESGEFDWAADTLTGIQSTIKERMMVTEPQRRAVTNIAKSKGWHI